MQSGITASPSLLTAFNTFISSSSQRALLASIHNESLIPLSTLPASPSFSTDLSSHIAPSLHPSTPLYILLRLDAPNDENADADGSNFIAITYIPDVAPVRQKTLFAATRHTLVRVLGAERFRATRFVTERAELEPEGWERYEVGEKAEGEEGLPLTQEERVLRGVREEEQAEAEVGRGRGSRERRELVGGRVKVGISEEAKGALEALGRGEGGDLVQLRIDIQSETIELASTSTSSITAADLSTSISATEPRYSFFRYRPNSSTSSTPSPSLIFIFTCPPETKIKSRMIYASSKLTFLTAVSGELGLEIAKKLEASSPSEITAATIEEEFAVKKTEGAGGFSRPKRPGKR